MDAFIFLVTLTVTLAAVALTIVWLLLPFAVFGVKKRLDTLISQNRQIIDRGRA